MVIFDLNELFKGFSLLLEEYEDDLCRAARLRVKDLPPRGEAWREHLLKHDQNIAAQYAVVETVRTAIEGKLHDLGEQLYGLLARIAEAEEAPKVKIGPADKGGPDVCS